MPQVSLHSEGWLFVKLLVLGNLNDRADVKIAAEILPEAKVSYGVDFVITLGTPQPLLLNEKTAKLFQDMDCDLHVALPGTKPTTVLPTVQFSEKTSVTTLENELGNSLRVLTSAPTGRREADLDDCAKQIIRLIKEGEEEPSILFLYHKSFDTKLELLKRCKGELSALLGCGTGIAAAEVTIADGYCAFLCDFGLTAERDLVLSNVGDSWEAEPGVDAVIMEIDDESGDAYSAFRLHWGPEDVSSQSEAAFSHELFFNAIKRTHAAPNVGVLFDEVTAVASRVFGHERVAVGFRFSGAETSQFLFSSQLFPDDQPAFISHFGKVLASEEAILAPNHPVQVDGTTYLAAAEWKTEEGTPDVRCVLGVVWSGEDEEVPSATSELVSELHGILHSSLLRLQFIESLRNQIERTTTLLQFSHALGGTIDLEDLLDRVVELSSKVIGAEWCSVLLLNKDKNELISRVSTGTNRVRRISADEGIVGWVVQNGVSQIVNSPQSDPRHSPNTDLEQGKSTRNLLCVPLKVKDRIIGVVEVRNKGEDKAFTEDDLDLLEAVANQAANPIENAGLHENLREMYRSTVEALASAIDAKDRYTHGHSRRVTLYAQAMAAALGWNEEELEEILFVGLLHDIGKIGVEDAVLGKRGPLTDEERAHINLHPSRGAEMLEHVSFLVSKIPGVRHHHERFDGKGYPDGLQGEEIPIQAQIICIVDAFDAMTSDRPYRSGMEPTVALERILKCSGTQFAPKYVELFENIFSERIMPIYRQYKDASKGEEEKK